MLESVIGGVKRVTQGTVLREYGVAYMRYLLGTDDSAPDEPAPRVIPPKRLDQVAVIIGGSQACSAMRTAIGIVLAKALDQYSPPVGEVPRSKGLAKYGDALRLLAAGKIRFRPSTREWVGPDGKVVRELDDRPFLPKSVIESMDKISPTWSTGPWRPSSRMHE